MLHVLRKRARGVLCCLLLAVLLACWERRTAGLRSLGAYFHGASVFGFVMIRASSSRPFLIRDFCGLRPGAPRGPRAYRECDYPAFWLALSLWAYGSSLRGHLEHLELRV